MGKTILQLAALGLGAYTVNRIFAARDMGVPAGMALKYFFSPIADVRRVMDSEREFMQCQARTDGQGPCAPRFTLQPLI